MFTFIQKASNVLDLFNIEVELTSLSLTLTSKTSKKIKYIKIILNYGASSLKELALQLCVNNREGESNSVFRFQIYVQNLRIVLWRLRDHFFLQF